MEDSRSGVPRYADQVAYSGWLNPSPMNAPTATRQISNASVFRSTLIVGCSPGAYIRHVKLVRHQMGCARVCPTKFALHLTVEVPEGPPERPRRGCARVLGIDIGGRGSMGRPRSPSRLKRDSLPTPPWAPCVAQRDPSERTLLRTDPGNARGSLPRPRSERPSRRTNRET